MSKRFRITIGASLTAILVIGLALGVVAYVLREREKERQAYPEMRLQNSVSLVLVQRLQNELMPSDATPMHIRGSGGGSGTDWYYSIDVSSPGRDFIHIEVRGRRPRGERFPIRVVEKKKAELNAEIIRQVTQEYQKRGWPYVVE